MLTQTHFTDFNIRAFKGLWKSLRGITKHYERLTVVNEVYEEVRRYINRERECGNGGMREWGNAGI